jgi:2-methylcitrate dehydratase PrpD
VSSTNHAVSGEDAVTGRLSQHVAELRDGDLSDVVRRAARWSILDTIGVTLLASTQAEGVEALVGLLASSGGKPESTVIGYGHRVPAWTAALANGAMSRAMMFDDYHTHKTHPGSTTVTAALALAERMGDVSGRELVTAVAIGNDLTCRMGSSIPLDVAKSRGWLTTDVFGTFGATAACARLLRLSVDEVRHAFGIALFEAAGTREAYSGHSESGRSAMMQAMSTGFRSQGAVFAALMAQAAITGPEDTFEGATGLYPVYFGGPADRSELLDGLGQRFESVGMGIKPSPGTWHAFTHVDTVRGLMRDNGITADDIAKVEVFVTSEGMRAFTPLAVKRHPPTSQDANHSSPYLIAAAIHHGTVTFRDLTAEGYEDERVGAIADRVIPIIDPEFERSGEVGPGEAGPARVQITLHDGSQFERDETVPYGHPQNPISEEDLIAKFRTCAAFAARPLAEPTIDRMIDVVLHLDDVADVNMILAAPG